MIQLLCHLDQNQEQELLVVVEYAHVHLRPIRGQSLTLSHRRHREEHQELHP